jgi:hypothetical protein
MEALMFEAAFLQEAATSWDLRSLWSYMGMGFVAIALLVWLVIIIIPFGKLLKRTGHNSTWSICFVIPLVNLVALYVFAFKRWPIDKDPNS